VFVRKPHQPIFGQAKVEMANKDEHSRFILRTRRAREPAEAFDCTDPFWSDPDGPK